MTLCIIEHPMNCAQTNGKPTLWKRSMRTCAITSNASLENLVAFPDDYIPWSKTCVCSSIATITGNWRNGSFQNIPFIFLILYHSLFRYSQRVNLRQVISIGTAINPHNLLKHFKSKNTEAGIPRIKFHSVASILLKNKNHPKLAAELFGHWNVNLTMNQYSHIINPLNMWRLKLYTVRDASRSP